MITRAQWEQPGYRVVDHSTSPPVDPTALTDVVIHYPGTTGPITTLDPVVWTQNLQRSYVDSRGYSVGYNFGYWADGTEIELRGWDFRNAANAVPGDKGANLRTLSLLIIVGAQSPATGAQIDAVRARRAQINNRTGRNIGRLGHGDLEPTTCPGAGIAAQLTAGLFDPQPTIEGDPMYLIPPPPERPGGRWLVCAPSGYRLANSHDIVDKLPQRPFTDVYRVQQYDDALAVASNRQVPA